MRMSTFPAGLLNLLPCENQLRHVKNLHNARADWWLGAMTCAAVSGREGCQALEQCIGLTVESQSPMAKGACRASLACSINALLYLVVREHPIVNKL